MFIGRRLFEYFHPEVRYVKLKDVWTPSSVGDEHGRMTASIEYLAWCRINGHPVVMLPVDGKPSFDFENDQVMLWGGRVTRPKIKEFLCALDVARKQPIDAYYASFQSVRDDIYQQAQRRAFQRAIAQQHEQAVVQQQIQQQRLHDADVRKRLEHLDSQYGRYEIECKDQMTAYIETLPDSKQIVKREKAWEKRTTTRRKFSADSIDLVWRALFGDAEHVECPAVRIDASGNEVLCTNWLARTNRGDWHISHIRPWQEAGSSIFNVRPACQQCNTACGEGRMYWRHNHSERMMD